MVCKKCGAEMNQDMKFCTRCGAPAAAEAVLESAAPVKKKGKAGKIFRRFLFAIVVMFLLFGISLLIGTIEIKNVSAEIPHPSEIVDVGLREELRTYMDGSVLIAENLESNPKKQVKDYLHMLIEDYGFYAEDSYSSYYRGYSQSYYVKYDVSIFGQLAHETFGLDIPGISVSIKREDSNDPFVLRFSVDEEITIAGN